MTESESPGAMAALDASVADRLGRQVTSETNRQRHERQLPQVIGATVIGSDHHEAGIARTYSPAFALHCNLVAALDDPVPQTADRLDQSNLSTDETVRRGQHGWARVRGNHTWEDWLHVGAALVIGRTEAMREAHVNKPIGHNYNSAFGTWLHRYGFETIDKGDRARLLEVMDKLVEIEAWRATLTESQRLLLNHPTTVVRRWRAATVVPDRNAPPTAPPATKTGIAHTTAADIRAAWDRAPQNERTEAIKSIGLDAIWSALPPDWMSEIARRLADRAQDCAPTVTTPACAIRDDLSIPEFLLRERPNAADIAPRSAPLLIPPAPISPDPAVPAPNAVVETIIVNEPAFDTEDKADAKVEPEPNRRANPRIVDSDTNMADASRARAACGGARDRRDPINKPIDLIAFCDSGVPPLEPFSRGGFTYGYNGWLIIRVNRRRNVPEVHNDSRLTRIDLDGLFEGIAQASFHPLPNFEPPRFQCPTCVGSGSDPDYPYRQYSCVACDGTGSDPVSVSLDGGLPFHLDSLLLIDGLPAVEIAVIPEEKLLFFRFRGGNGALMSLVKRLSRHINLNNKKKARRSAINGPVAPLFEN
jgi:hypothetical protein